MTAAFIGDSYSQGNGASSESLRWTSLLSAREQWKEMNFARGGSGYISTSGVTGCGLAYCPSYLEMVPEVIASRPDIVVVAGGQNDFDDLEMDRYAEGSRIAAVYRALRDGLPDALIVAVGPSTPGLVAGAVVELDSEVQDAAGAVNGIHVSLSEPNAISRASLGPDGVHVDDSGHAAIAARVAAAVERERASMRDLGG
ncbi:SGNH/GDSL hydrolase family protein [Naasia lichenicola]|uniref:SGNH/GDSL hydrolase family protein n=1 Tax=Naasia lichenicola TaxID=2565933 RepID=UPI00130DF238|nr:SGNH/GDSL hydrolase family protein [Naasia lichenicola]